MTLREATRPVGTCLVVLLTPYAAHAELDEHRVGGGATVVFPALVPSEATQMASIGFGGRFDVSFGLFHHRLYLLGRLGIWKHGGDLSGYRHVGADSSVLNGTLRYHGEGYRGELGIAWQALAGRNVAPYLRALVGYQWTIFREQELLAYGESLGVTLSDRGEASVTASVGASLEQRLFDVVVCGFSVDYTRAFSRLYRYDITVSLISSYYWF